jgi:sugar (pentulose or hexulose) kinase
MYLGLDLGTTHVKAAVVDRRQCVVGAGVAAVDRFPSPDGGVEQDIEQIWNAVGVAIRQALQNVEAAAVRAIGVSSQGGALQLLDARQEPLGKVISWLDGRGRPFDLAVTRDWGADFLAEHVGHGASAMTIGQLMRLRQQSPAMWEAARHVAFVGDVIVGRLCGRRAHDATSLAIAMLHNPWLRRADPEVLARLGIDESRLPDLLPVTTSAGELLAEASRQTGLPAGIPVSPAIHDQYAVSLGTGAVHEGDVTFGAGTAWVLLANSRRLARPITAEAFVCPHPVPGLFGQMLSLRNGGSAIQWVLDLLGRGRASADAVDGWLAETPPGCDGLCFRPLLSPAPEVDGASPPTGTISGITLAHRPSHLLRAVVEGLAREVKLRLDCLAAADMPVKRLRMCGGAAASRQTPQIVADITQCPVSCVEAFDPGTLGAAAIARAMVEPDRSLADLAGDAPPLGRTFLPRSELACYRELPARYRQPPAPQGVSVERP